MEVKEAIEKIKIWYQTYLANCTSIFNDDKAMCEIIALLQQGEKYRQMWEELIKGIEKREKRCEIACDIVYVSTLRDIEQKYFPEELKRGSYFYECTSEEIYHLKKIPFKEAKE